MKLQLKRVSVVPEGAFGVLLQDGLPFAVTLELTDDLAGNTPKIPAGTYKCVRKHFNKGNYGTFEVTGIPGHSLILFHVGNYERDTEGCILVGSTFRGSWIGGSQSAFDTLMEKTAEVNEFDLEVSG